MEQDYSIVIKVDHEFTFEHPEFDATATTEIECKLIVYAFSARHALDAAMVIVVEKYKLKKGTWHITHIDILPAHERT